MASYAQIEANRRNVQKVYRTWHSSTAKPPLSEGLHDVLKLQKERKLQGIGFVSQEVEEASAETPEEPQTPAARAGRNGFVSRRASP